MDKDVWEQYRSFGVAMAAASARVLQLRREGMSMQAKGPLDVVTEADKASEEILSDWVAANFPEDGIVAEEGTTRPSRSGFAWYFDPIDGTKNFAVGLPFFGISAGRAMDGNGVFGWLSFPVHGFHLFAVRGGGVYMGPSFREAKPLSRVAFPGRLQESVIVLGLTPGYEHLLPAFNKKCWNSVYMGSCVYEASLVIQGHYSACVHTGAKQYDVAASIVIAEELGLAVSRLDGKPIDLREKKISIVIAQNRQILEEVLEICNDNL